MCLKALYGRRNGTIGQIQRPERQRKEAPGSDKGLLRIVEWLKEYGVPISFVPFTLHAGEAGTDDAAAQSRNDERTPCGTAAMSRFLSSSDRNVPLTGLPRRFGNTSRPE